MSDLEISYFDDLARIDWVYLKKDDYKWLHAPVGDHPDADVSAKGRTACGVKGRMEIPGLFSRMGLPRCRECCEATGLPIGMGSPKNDPDCRRVLGLPETGGK